jgi:hypothetical protein
MKKAILAVLIALLAMLAVTCDSAFMSANLSSGVGQVPPVEGWTTLSIKVDGPGSRARAMSQTLNELEVDFYEVVFVYNEGVSNSVTVRDTNDGTVTPWEVTVPAVNYNGGNNKAVLFAGQSGSPNVLIAIGYISAGGNLLGSATSSITFTLSAIESGVTTDKSTSSFKITGDTLNPSTIATTNADGETGVPVFKIHAGTDPIDAIYTFTIPKGGAVVNGAGTVTADTVTGTTNTVTVGTSAITDPVSGALTEGDVDFEFTITPGTTVGHSKISIAVPVVALNTVFHADNGTQSYETWSLQGGLDNTKLDKDDEGGAVLLEVIAAPTTPTVSIESSGSGWDGLTDTLTLTIGGGEEIIITASADGFADNGSVTFTWKTNSTGSTANPSGDSAATTIDDASISGNTLTIPSTSTALTAPTASTFYIYCIGNEGTDDEASNVITIEFENYTEGTMVVPIPGF